MSFFYLKMSRLRRAKNCVVPFTLQLAQLLKGHVSLLRSLQLLHQRFGNLAFKGVVKSLIYYVNGGNTLSEALQLQKGLFLPTYIAIVNAGERASSLAEALWHVGKWMERSQKFYKKLLATLLYPGLVASIGGMLFIAVLIWVVPQFEQLFQDIVMESQLPWLTRRLFGLSTGCRAHGLALLGFGVGGMIVIKQVVKRFSHAYWDQLWLQLPYIGDMVVQTGLIRISHALHLLLANKILLTDALLMASSTVRNTYFRKQWHKILRSVQQGASLGASLNQQPLIPLAFTEVIQQGEAVANLPQACKLAADLFEEGLERQLLGITNWLEPVLIVILAVFIGSIVLALFLPMMSLVEKVGIA